MWLFFLPSGFVRYYVISNLTPAANSRRSRGKGEENLFFCEKIISSSSNSKSTWTRLQFPPRQGSRESSLIWASRPAPRRGRRRSDSIYSRQSDKPKPVARASRRRGSL